MTTRLDNAGVVSTGSTTERSLADRFADVVNVKDFGAKGDGTTDDYAAIQAAITAVVTAGTYSIYLPAGVYIVTGTLTWPEDNDDGYNYAGSMYGDGAADINTMDDDGTPEGLLRFNTGTVIKHEPTVPSTHCIVDNPGRLNVRDLSIIGNSSTGNPTDGSNVGILIGNGGTVSAGGSGALIERVFVYGCLFGISILYNGPDGVSINNSTLQKNGTGLAIGGSSHAVTVVGTRISNSSSGVPNFAKYGVRLGYSADAGSKPVTATFIGCDIERSSVLQVDIQEALCATFIGCYFEGGRYTDQSSQIMRIAADHALSAWSRSITIQSCYFNGLYVVDAPAVAGNGDGDSWLIEFGCINRVKDLTLINNVYTNTNQGFIKMSGVGTFDSVSVVSVMNGDNDSGKPLSDNDSKFAILVAGDGSHTKGVTFNRDVRIGATALLCFEERAQPNPADSNTAEIYLSTNNNLYVKFDSGEPVLLATHPG